MDTLLKAISQHPNGTDLIVEWKDRCTILGNIDTIFETDNGLEPDDEAYREFHVCLLHVNDISGYLSENEHFSKGDYVEISMQKQPSTVRLRDGQVIWSAE